MKTFEYAVDFAWTTEYIEVEAETVDQALATLCGMLSDCFKDNATDIRLLGGCDLASESVGAA